MSKTRKVQYPMGTVSHGTMREEDLIPAFCSALDDLAKQPGIVSRRNRAKHRAMVREIEKRMEADGYYDSEDAGSDLNEFLFDALNEYAAPYFCFSAHPGDGSDYGFWFEYEAIEQNFDTDAGEGVGLQVSDLAEIPKDYRGEVMLVNDHGNTSLYVKTARTLKEVWSIV